MTSVGIMASAVASTAVFLLEDCDNFTDAPWNTAGSVSVTASGFTGNGFSIAAATSANITYPIPSAAQTDTVTFGCQIKFSAIPASAAQFVLWLSDSGATIHTSLRIYNPSGTLAIYRNSPLSALGSPAAHGMVTGTWYYLEASVKLSDTAGQGVVRKNGSQLYATSAAADTKSGGTKTVFDAIQFRGGTGMAYIIDDLYLRNDASFGAP